HVNSQDITSYDYFAPISEAGDVNEKYLAIRKWIKSIPDWKNKPYDVPANNKKTAYGTVSMIPLGGFFDANGGTCVTADDPMSFEQLGHPFGFVVYMKKLEKCGKTLEIEKLKDFGYVILGKNHIGTMINSYYGKSKRTVSLEGCKDGDTLAILVENSARLTSGTADDHKGILSDVRLDGEVLKGWDQCKVLFPFTNFDKVKN
ncbi:hypothetical protein OESDEN_23907, partial [Oesophagostomum dentatum]